MNRGSCLCGDITWVVSGPPTLLSNCHCSMCRKLHGSAFATFMGVAADDFRWESGEDVVATYESSPGGGRPFCPRCGAVVPTVMGDAVFMPAGNVAGPLERAIDSHMFVDSKAAWHTITDSAPQFSDYPPGFDAKPVHLGPREPPTPGAVGGSCLCGAVAYEFDGPATQMVCCHCSRCRRSRASAYSAQAFCPSDRFRWLRGADALRSYKLPESLAFVATFCGECGSLMPTDFGEIVLMPAGALDQDPGVTPTVHIFTGSKAQWCELPEDVPCFEDMPR